MQQNSTKKKLLTLTTMMVPWVLFISIISVLIPGCASTPRYTRKNTEIPKQARRIPPKPETKSSSSEKQKHKIKKVVPIPPKIPVNKAFAPEMRIPSGPLQKDDNESYRFTYYQKGKASFYGNKFHGRKTANGEHYDQNAFTAAHPKLPFNSMVRVTNMENNKTVIVRINDRGPFIRGRIIDISKAAAKKIGILSKGVVEVVIEVDKNVNK